MLDIVVLCSKKWRRKSFLTTQSTMLPNGLRKLDECTMLACGLVRRHCNIWYCFESRDSMNGLVDTMNLERPQRLMTLELVFDNPEVPVSLGSSGQDFSRTLSAGGLPCTDDGRLCDEEMDVEVTIFKPSLKLQRRSFKLRYIHTSVVCTMRSSHQSTSVGCSIWSAST